MQCSFACFHCFMFLSSVSIYFFELCFQINLPTVLLTVVMLFQPEVTSMFTREQRAFKSKSYERMPWKRSGPGKKLSVVTNDFSLFDRREERWFNLLYILIRGEMKEKHTWMELYWDAVKINIINEFSLSFFPENMTCRGHWSSS